MLRNALLKRRGFTLEQVVLSSLIDACRSIVTGDDEEAEEELELFALNPFEDYQGDPVRFCENVLGVFLTDEIKDMLRSVQRNPRTLARSSNGTGKTFAAACLAIYWFLVYPDAQVYTLAAPPETNLRLLLWGEIGALVEGNPHLFRGMKISIDSLHIMRNRKSFITGLAIPQSQDPAKKKARFSGKHAPHLLFIGDEGDAIPSEIYDAIETCMSGGVARLLVLYNPRHKSGHVFMMEQRKRARIVTLKAFNHPNVLSGDDLIPGAVSRDITVARIHDMTEALRPGERFEAGSPEFFVVPDFLVGVIVPKDADENYPALEAGVRRITDQEFYPVVLGEYPTQAANQVFNEAHIDAAVTRWLLYTAQYGNRPPLNLRPVVGYDVAELGTDTNVMTFYFGSFMATQIVWKEDVDVVEAGDRAADNFFSNNGAEAFVDATGVGAGAWAQMRRRGCIAHRIMVGGRDGLEEKEDRELDADDFKGAELEGFQSIRAQMIWGFREWLRTDKGAMIPLSVELKEEMLACEYWKNLKGQICITKTEDIVKKIGRSPDRLMSAALRHAKRPDGAPADVHLSSYAYNGNGNGHRNGRNNGKPAGPNEAPRIRKAGLGM